MSDLFAALPGPLKPPNASVGGRGGREPALSANGKRIGRPPGARNKGSLDLAKYIEARFAGMTPGQQAAELGLVTAKELKRAGGSMLTAMAVKALELAVILRCDGKEAFLLLQRERAELFKYIHQVQPQAKPGEGAPLPTIFLADRADFDAAASSPQLAGPEAEIVDDFDLPAEQVSPPKSHDAP